MNFIKTKNINSGIRVNPTEFVNISEQIYNDQLVITAEKIRLESNDKPVILLSGPSGSGKTTSAFRIAKELENKGMTVHTISMDNYFLPNGVGEMPLDENGNIDLESPLRLDIQLFSEHLHKLIAGEKVDVPIFDFTTQSRIDFIPTKREKNEIIIFEGIHALNPLVTGDTAENTTCVYVSVRTRITGSNGDVLHPANIRLMRRLNRDRLFRGRKLEEIFAMHNSVSRGEELYIMPFKNRADIDIDTFLAYEASVYGKMLFSDLQSSAELMTDNDEFKTLLNIMKELVKLDLEYVPLNSLVREFVGGSSFKY